MRIEDVAGLSMTITGVLIESYVKEGYADPTMYKALKAVTELAERFVELLREQGDHELAEDVIEGLVTGLQLTTMEAGEVIGRIIDEHKLPVDKSTFERND
jgi:hypothetical protein